MIDTGVIKGKIIDFALQGKLTKQYSEDSDVKQLLTNIAQKKNIVVTLSETEQPYCIPANWCWIKFLNCKCKLNKTLTHNNSQLA